MVKISRVRHGGRRKPVGKRRGFTLIEVLIATTLMAALLVALWRLVGIYTQLRGKGDLHAGRVGNVSVMMEQFEEDLRNLPDVRPQTVAHMELAALRQVETGPVEIGPAKTGPAKTGPGPVESEMVAFDEAYDDNPAVETLSESAFALERADQHAQVISQDEDLALSEDDSFDSNGGSGADLLARQQDRSDLARSEAIRAGDQTPVDNLATAGCLIGDEQSLTLANLDCQVSRAVGETAARASHDLLAQRGTMQDPTNYELASPSGYGTSTSLNESEHGETVQLPVRFVRYWLAGVMPLMAQAATDEHGSADSEGNRLPTTGIGSMDSGEMGSGAESAVEEGETGLYREEVVGLGARARMRPLSGRETMDNLEYDSLRDFSNAAGTSEMDTPGLKPFEEMKNPDGMTRRWFHLAQVEWAKFRYFDGNKWQSAWDSRVQGELPVAIEMSLWLMRRNARQAASPVARETPGSPAAEMTWAEVEAMSEADAQISVVQEDRSAGKIDSDRSISTGDNPMERQPELRQLVVLRTVPVSGDRLPGDRVPEKKSTSASSSSVLAPQRADVPRDL